MSSNVQLSVIVPTYNAGALLIQAVASLYRAQLPTFEVLVVDDGSTDTSLAVLKRTYRLQFDQHQLRILHVQHQGAGAARNIGLNHARGNYVLFLDADDQLLAKTDLRGEFEAVTADVVVYSRRLTVQQISLRTHRALVTSVLGLRTPVLFDSMSTSKLYRRAFLTLHHLNFPTHVQIGEDLVFNFLVLSCTDNCQFVSTGIYEQRWVPTSITHAINDQRLATDTLRLIQLMQPLLAQQDPALWQRFVLKRYLMLMVGLAKSNLPAKRISQLLAGAKREFQQRLPQPLKRPIVPVTHGLQELALVVTWRYPGFSRWELPIFHWFLRRKTEPVNQVI